METSKQVLIVGAGPTGLTLACDLARRGVAFRIVDAAPRPFAGSRAKGLQPRSLEVLDDLGVAEEVLAGGRFHILFRGYDGATVLGERDFHEGRSPTPHVPYASTLLIPQWRTEAILRGRLAALGGAVEHATTLAGFTQDADGVTATLSRGGATEEARAAYLVGCDGGHSFVRRALGVSFEGETREAERILVGDVEVDGLDRERWHAWPRGKGGPVALCPLPGTTSFQFQALLTGAEPLDPSLELFQKILDERTGRTDLRLRDPGWLSLYRANVRMVDRYRVGRVFLAGDAAHVHSPVGAQGMNTGIQDAYNLGWKLGQVLAGAPGALLDTYEEERLPIAASMLGVTSKLHRQAFSGGAIERRSAETLQLDLHYRGSSLARDAIAEGDERGATARVRAGDRAPDAPCRDAAGAPVRLFDAFRGPHFTILAFGAAHAATVAQVNARHARPGAAVRAYAVIQPGEAAGAHTLVDAEGHARAGYDIHDDALVLVRPDGYIARVARPGALDLIEDDLGRLTPPH